MPVAGAKLRWKLAEKVNFQWLLLGGAIGVTVYLVLVPFFFLFWSTLQTASSPLEVTPLTLKNYADVYLDPATYMLLADTFMFALGSGAIGLGLGVSFAWLLERTNIPFKTLLYALVPLPLVMPGMLKAIAWILLLSPKIGIFNLTLASLFGLDKAPFDIYTMGGMIFVQGVGLLVPLVFLMVVGAFRSMDPALEEAGAISGAGTLATLRRITLPIMLPAILGATIYIFALAIEVIEVPGIIGLAAGIKVFSTRIYMLTRITPAEWGLASTLALTFVFVAGLLMILYTWLTRIAEKFTTITGKGYRPRLINIGKWKYAAFALVTIYLLVALFLPFFILVWGSLLPYYQVPSMESLRQVSLDAYSRTLGYRQVGLAFRNTVTVMLIAATFTVFLASLIAWIVVRTKLRGKRLLDALTFLPHGMPGIVIGLSLLIVYLKLNFIPIYNTIWILIVGFTTRYMTFPVRSINAAMHQIHKELEEAAHVSGVSWGRIFIRITLPLLMPTLVSAWVWAAMRAVTDLSIPLMLSAPKTTVIPTLIWHLWEDGNIADSCVLAVIVITFMAIIMVLGRVFGFRIGRVF